MEGISIFTIRKGTFREDSITITLLYKESVISPAIYLNELSQVICNFNVDMILGNFNINTLFHREPSLKIGFVYMIWLLIYPHI